MPESKSYMYISYAKEQGVSESKAKEYWEKASKEVKEETGKSKDELSDGDWEHIMGIFKKIISNSKKQEIAEIKTTKDYIIENIIIKEGTKVLEESFNVSSDAIATSYQDLRNLSYNDILQYLKFYSKFSLSELRKRQDINSYQSKEAYKQKNDLASTNLKINADMLMFAVDYKEFGKDEGASIDDYVGRVQNTIDGLK